MKALQASIDKMNQLLSELIQIATQLRDLSLQVIAEEDLLRLQKHQAELLSQLENVDQHIQNHYRHQIDPDIHKHFHQQLQTFQQLNREFIQNLHASHGLIQFELYRLEEEVEDDFSSYLARLKKALPTPNTTQAIKSKKNKKT